MSVSNIQSGGNGCFKPNYALLPLLFKLLRSRSKKTSQEKQTRRLTQKNLITDTTTCHLNFQTGLDDLTHDRGLRTRVQQDSVSSCNKIERPQCPCPVPLVLSSSCLSVSDQIFVRVLFLGQHLSHHSFTIFSLPHHTHTHSITTSRSWKDFT